MGVEWKCQVGAGNLMEGYKVEQKDIGDICGSVSYRPTHIKVI